MNLNMFSVFRVEDDVIYMYQHIIVRPISREEDIDLLESCIKFESALFSYPCTIMRTLRFGWPKIAKDIVYLTEDMYL